MPGRSTLTATSRPSFRTAKWTWAIEALATGAASKLREDRLERPAEGPLDDGARDRGGKRRHAILQLGELLGEVGRQQVAPRREHLAELDEDRPEPLQAQAQALAARRVEAPPDGDDANEQADPGLAKARQRQLVEPVAKNRDADDDEPGDVPHRGGGCRVGARRAARSVSALAAWRAWHARRSRRTATSSRAGASPTRRARSSCRSQRRFSISQLTSVAKVGVAVDPDRRPLAADEADERERRIRAVDRDRQVRRQARRAPRATRPGRRA